jgi:hypothetical protein
MSDSNELRGTLTISIPLSALEEQHIYTNAPNLVLFLESFYDWLNALDEGGERGATTDDIREKMDELAKRCLVSDLLTLVKEEE